jgi:hypothetical protein
MGVSGQLHAPAALYPRGKDPRYPLDRRLFGPQRSLFKRIEILALPCEYIFSLMNFIVNNQEHFKTNCAIHSVNTRNKNQLHRPIANLSCFQKSAYYAGIKIFSLLSSLTSIINKKAQFKVALKIYLIIHSFYSGDEILMFTNKS